MKTFEKLRYGSKRSEIQNQIKQTTCTPWKAEWVGFTACVNAVERRTKQSMYVQHKVQSLSRKHCCSGKAVIMHSVWGRDSSVGIATRYGLDGPGIESRWGARFSASVQTGPGGHPASYTTGTGSFPGVKRPGRGVDHPPLI